MGDGQDIQLNKYSTAGALLWSQVISTGVAANDIATSLALSPDGADIVLTGDISGGATWITAAYNATTGARRWLVTAPEGIAARDVVVDSGHVYVTGQGNVGITGFLSLVAYNRATGTRQWRIDKKPADASSAAGLRMNLASDGSLVVTGQAARGFLDWYTVAFESTGAVRWEAIRNGGLNTDEIPASLLVLTDGTTVVTGTGGPNLPGGFIPWVTAGYSQTGVPLWEAFSGQATVWASALPNGNVCATGGYDALITCWSTSNVPLPPSAPKGLTATGLTNSSIGLTWTNSTTNQDEVRIERCKGSGCTNFAQVAVVAGTATQYTDGGLATRTAYTYRVRAHNPAGYSPYSNIAIARTTR